MCLPLLFNIHIYKQDIQIIYSKQNIILLLYVYPLRGKQIENFFISLSRYSEPFFYFYKKNRDYLREDTQRSFFYCGQTTKRGEGGRELPPDPLRKDEAQEKLPQK